jgi:RNA polymerase sigma-70 factor (ECF subfamily)
MIDDFPAVLHAARVGEEWAIAVLWQELNHRLVRFLQARNRDAAEDIASETWLTVATKLRDFHGDEIAFRAWLFTIARNRVIDWQRRAQRRPQRAVNPDAFADRVASDDPAREALEALDTEAALAMIAQLPEAQSEVILLRVLGGLDANRVAKITGKRPGTVRMLQLRGLRRLADLMGASDFEDQDVTR